MANYPVTNTLKLRKLNEKIAVMRSCSQQHLKSGHFTFLHFIALHKHKKLYKHNTALKTILLTIPGVIETTNNT